MKTKRNINNIARTASVPEQNMQQFISDSPWSGYDLISVLQQDITMNPQFQEESVLIIDESADEKAGEHSAGSGRQHNGRLGKIEMSQVGVFLSLTNNGYHNWIDGELYFPKKWFTDEYAAKRKRIGMPENRTFATKLELALQMTKRAYENGVSFSAVDCDTLYGRSGKFRDALDQEDFEYYADVPINIQVYLEPPQIVYPLTERGIPSKNHEVIGIPYTVEEVQAHEHIEWEKITLRPNERGMLRAKFARFPVWTVRDDGSLRQEWLLIRQAKKKTTYSLSNAAENTSLFTMAQRKSQRYFIERSNQDAKSEFGWDEFQAIKYKAWEHHLALTIMANWFITETRLDWAQKYARDPDLLEKYETDVLPALSVANVRELLRATMPLPQLSPQQAAKLVIKHLDNRTRSRKSRLKKALST
ncbi:MAG: IS701 family transposase [Chloroflexi bacterium]|nr:IS701 family transposase [Chloroflexota bacterium]